MKEFFASALIPIVAIYCLFLIVVGVAFMPLYILANIIGLGNWFAKNVGGFVTAPLNWYEKYFL
jgi:hypothetical protein